MALHLGLAAVAGLAHGAVSTTARLIEGENFSDALEGGVKDTLNTTVSICTLGLVDPDQGIDIDSSGIHECYGHDEA